MEVNRVNEIESLPTVFLDDVEVLDWTCANDEEGWVDRSGERQHGRVVIVVQDGN